MTRNSNEYHNIPLFIFIFYSVFLFVLKISCWTYFTADPVIHNDSLEYFKGYEFLTVSGLDLDGLSNYFGRYPEILLPLLYLLSSLFIKLTSELEIIYLNTFIFISAYVLGIFNIFFKIRNFNIKARDGVHSYYWFAIFLSIVPPGVALQIARQAISFAVLIIFLPLLSRSNRMYFNILITVALMSLMHLGNTLNSALVVLTATKKLSALFVAIIIFVTSILIYNDLIYILFSMTQSEFRIQESKNFTYTMILNLLIILFLFKNKLLRWNNLEINALFALILFLLFDYQFFMHRVFFGFDFFIIPYLMLGIYYKYSLCNNALTKRLRGIGLLLPMLSFVITCSTILTTAVTK